MATPLQQASVRRKLIYAALIVVLFTGNAFAWRGLAFYDREPGTDRVTVHRPPAFTVTARAQDLELSESDEGDPDLTGAAVRLLLTGSRGLAVTWLWHDWHQKQIHHEWNEV